MPQSKVACEFPRKHKIQVLEWSGNSPDLNPIENLWGTLKDKVADKKLSSVKHLWQVIKESWLKDLTSEYCSTLVNNLPRRIQAVNKSILDLNLCDRCNAIFEISHKSVWCKLLQMTVDQRNNLLETKSFECCSHM